MRIYFIRHGRTGSNVGGLLDTAFPGPPLDEVGLEQAQALAAKLSHEPIEVVVSSDIIRARQTAEPLARVLGVPLVIDPGVREIHAGRWEMRTDWEDYVRVIRSWQKDFTRSMPGGDSGYSFFSRFDRAVAELEDYDCVAVVSHGGALKTWLAGRGGMQVPEDLALHNTDVVVVDGHMGAWTIVSWAGRDLRA